MRRFSSEGLGQMSNEVVGQQQRRRTGTPTSAQRRGRAPADAAAPAQLRSAALSPTAQRATGRCSRCASQLTAMGACPSPTRPSLVVLAEAPPGVPCSLSPARGPRRSGIAAALVTGRGLSERAGCVTAPAAGWLAGPSYIRVSRWGPLVPVAVTSVHPREQFSRSGALSQTTGARVSCACPERHDIAGPTSTGRCLLCQGERSAAPPPAPIWPAATAAFGVATPREGLSGAAESHPRTEQEE